MQQGEAIKETTFIIAKAKVDCIDGVVMADLFDRHENRLYFHKTKDGEFMFDVYYLKDRVKGKTNETPRNIFQIINLLEEHGVSITYTAENEGRTRLD